MKTAIQLIIVLTLTIAPIYKVLASMSDTQTVIYTAIK